MARRVGVPESKVSYWKSGARMPSIAECIQVARAFGRPPLEGLVGAGYLEPDEIADQVVLRPGGLSDVSDVELADELLRRTLARDALQ
ncbi:helix-turn-helix transcriptional regulator [Microbacterium schleiferi]|uniref:Helix-turn-helix transcriptional regulator n=1 Tax=Microbacterium schleiferi TaxID=69362 RepID=A0A7S8N0E2_9MICO|nr:helix-turn-helix transcriptional regulator [Microbacterium schleiferi]